MSSSQNMKVWQRCYDCGMWSEDYCTCFGCFDPHTEELAIKWADTALAHQQEVEFAALWERYGFCRENGCLDCDGLDRFCDEEDYGRSYPDDYSCSACGKDDCGEGNQPHYCGYLSWGEEQVRLRSAPTRVLAEALGPLWQQEGARQCESEK